MYARRQIDIEWSDLLFALKRCLCSPDSGLEAGKLSEICPRTHNFLAVLSVRTALDLLLAALQLPPGTEVLISAITIKDMVSVLESHGLVPVAVDLDLDTLEPRLDLAKLLLTERTRLLIVAPLYGTRMDMGPTVEFAKSNKLFLVEDLAQAYAGDLGIADSRSDAVMFSFGPIKTSTALGGALFGVKDPQLYAQIVSLERKLNLQSRLDYVSKLAKFSLIKVLALPLIYGCFVRLTKFFGRDYDLMIGRWTRGFSGGDFFQNIRRRPTAALLALLNRRISRSNQSVIQKRQALGKKLRERLSQISLPGCKNSSNTYWVFPVCVSHPEILTQRIRSLGFDATRGASNLVCVGSAGATQYAAQRLLESVVYIPVYPQIPEPQLEILARAVVDFVSDGSFKHERSIRSNRADAQQHQSNRDSGSV